ncbi:hypothetical protein Glove_140g107 [Diversispora epigaea]|uniref:Uncharacterized protein n=1 Tax=Diversispora epigaea TaxID=1348612 RepID=A0A397J3V7_9GLOM|nr:hypothetical protein Glove_140g107 [Diversispora epigaea]
MCNRNIFAFVITRLSIFTIPNTSNTSRRIKPRTESTALFIIGKEKEKETTRKKITKINLLDKKIDSFLKEQIDIKKRLKNIKLLSEINNDSDFSKQKLQKKLSLKPEDEELEMEETTEKKSEEWEKEGRSSKRRKTSGDRVPFSLFTSLRLAFSPHIFGSPDIPNTTREEGDTTNSDTESAKINSYNKSDHKVDCPSQGEQNSYNKSDHKVDCPSQGEQIAWPSWFGKFHETDEDLVFISQGVNTKSFEEIQNGGKSESFVAVVDQTVTSV